MAKKRKPLPPPVVLPGGTQIDAETARRAEEMKNRSVKRSPMETLRQLGSAALGGAIGVGEGAVGLGTFGYDVLKDTMTGGPVKRGVQAISDYAHGAPVDLKVPMPETDAWTKEVDKGQRFWEEQGVDGPAMSVGRVAGNVIAPGPEAAQVMKTAERAKSSETILDAFLDTARGAPEPANLQDIYKLDPPDITDITPKRPPFDPNADLSKMSEDELGEWMEQAVGELGNQNTLGEPNTWLDEPRPFYHGNNSTEPPDEIDYFWGERDGANLENPFPTPADTRARLKLEADELAELETPFDVSPIPDPQQVTYNDVVRMIEDLQNAPPNPLGPVNRWSGDPFSIYNGSTAPPKWYDYSTGEREIANPDNPFPTQADKAAANRREHEKWMKEYEEQQRYYQTLKDERAAHEADPENTSFFSTTTAKGLMERAKQRPVGTPPIVIDRTKEALTPFQQQMDANGAGLAKRYAKDAARPEEVALVRDAAARIAEEYPRALRLVGRIELADTRHMSLGSIINPPLAWYGDNPGGVIKINMNALRDEIAKNGPVAADATLYHELVHAAQHAIRPKGPGDMTLEPPAYRRMFRLFGGVDDRQFAAEDLPLSPREQKTGAEDWRYSRPQRRGAPAKSSKPGKW